MSVVRLVRDASEKQAVLAQHPRLRLGEDPVPCKECIDCRIGYPETCMAMRIVLTLDEWAWHIALWPCTSSWTRVRHWAGFEANDPPQSAPALVRLGDGSLVPPESLL